MLRLLTSTLAQTPLPYFAGDDRRACRDVDPRLFFPTTGENGRAAIDICNRCPFIDPCREYAIPITDLHGVWGATSPGDRQHIRIKRERAARRNGGTR